MVWTCRGLNLRAASADWGQPVAPDLADNPTYRDPRVVTGSHCYQNQPMPGTSDGHIMLNVISATQMQVAYSPMGVCPARFPAGFETYHR